MADQRKQPGYVMAVLALLGVFSLPQVLKLPEGGSTQPEPEKAAAAPKGEGDDEDSEEPIHDLKPLIDYLSHDGSPPKKTKDLADFLDTKLKRTKVHCLVVALPAPIESIASARFDEYLDVVQRAIELQGYILDRSLLPWRRISNDAATPADSTTKIVAGGKELGLALETTSPTKPRASGTGLMVFKHAFPKQESPPKDPSILLAFLVPESPISGIHKRAFVRSLDLVNTYFRPKLSSEKSGERSVLHIIAPCFNSSQRSLEIALRDWNPLDKQGYHFRIVSSGTTQIDRARIEQLFAASSKHKLTFHSMVHAVAALKDAMLDYLTTDQHYPPSSIAILIESNTGLAQALVQHERKKSVRPEDSPVEFLFPLQVSEVRKAYEKGGFFRNGKTDDPAAPERLRIPPDEAGAPRDLPKSFTPATSAALDEMALTQVLTTIARRPYQAVGIIATDPFDVVFLAREVNRFCPNVRLFTLTADLLLARPAEVVDLRGMLVASTYPLYPTNQWMTTPFRDGPRVFFSNRGAQGFYNATVAHLWEMRADEPANPDLPSSPQLLEFGRPYDVKPQAVRQPPVWISAIGERGLYPITYFEYEETGSAKTEEAGTPARPESGGYLYSPEKSPEGRPLSKWPADGEATAEAKAVIAEAKAAMQPRPHLLFWLLLLTVICMCILVTAVTCLYAWWSTDPRKHRFGSILGLIQLGHVLRLFNCEVAEADDDGAAIDPVSKERLEGDYIPQERFEKPADHAYPGHDVRLTTSLHAADNLRQNEKKNLVLLVLENNSLRVRTFDSDGNKVLATDEKKLKSKARQIKKLKQRLAGLVPPRHLTGNEKDELKDEVASIVRDSQDPPRVGAGIYVLAMNLITFGLSVCIFAPFLIGMNDSISPGPSIPRIMGKFIPWSVYWLTVLAGALVAASTAASLAEFLLGMPVGETTPEDGPGAFVRRYYRRISVFSVFVLAIVVVVATVCARISQISNWQDLPLRKVAFERISNLPSGVSPIFPVLFLSTGAAAFIHFQLARRRLYRMSYLRSDPKETKRGDADSHFEAMLKEMRVIRGKVDRLIATSRIGLPQENPLVLCGIFLLYIHMIFRWSFRDFPSTLEGRGFNWAFWLLFLAVFTSIVWRAIKLRALWRTMRKMLHLAVDLPLSHAYDRIPARFKEWFFGAEGFEIRRQIILQQSAALASRPPKELAGVFCKVFGEKQPSWESRFAGLNHTLEKNDGTLDSTRAVYPLLTHVWGSLPVEEVPRAAHAGEDKSADWLKYWPLTPAQGQKLSEDERATLRDWVRMAENLIALQIVRWFAPALSQLLPIMQFLVISSISLLLAVTSYPFGHQGWLMTLIVGLILVVAIVIANVLVGINRDELISRVSDTTPGRLKLDSKFISAILTTFAPLIGALLAISFDLSDLLHTWFGPLFQLF